MMEKSRVLSRESGVSETVGFMIIFSIVLTGIAIITVYGYPALMQEQQNANVKNMEKNMLVLQSDLKSLTFKSVPYQETAIQVSGGTLKVDPVENPPDPVQDAHFSLVLASNPSIPEFYLGDLRYESTDGQTTVTLENGAVHTRDWSSPNGSAMLAAPSWFYDYQTGTYVIQMIELEASLNLAQTGIGVVKMELVPSISPPYPPILLTAGDSIWYNPSQENTYKIAWNNYLRRPELNLIETTPGSGIFNFNVTGDPKKLVIKQYTVKVLSL